MAKNAPHKKSDKCDTITKIAIALTALCNLTKTIIELIEKLR